MYCGDILNKTFEKNNNYLLSTNPIALKPKLLTLKTLIFQMVRLIEHN